MNRFFTKQQIVSEYNLPAHLQAELFRAVQAVEQDSLGEPLYLEDKVDSWLADRYAGSQGAPAQQTASQDSFMTIREVACLLRCSYTEARDRLLDGRIRAIKDGRWLRTCRQWVEDYIASKTIKAAQSEPGIYTVPNPPRKRQNQFKLKLGGIGYQFLKEREEAD